MAKKYLKKKKKIQHSWKLGTCKSISFKEARTEEVAVNYCQLLAFSLDVPCVLYVTDYVGMYSVVYY